MSYLPILKSLPDQQTQTRFRLCHTETRLESGAYERAIMMTSMREEATGPVGGNVYHKTYPLCIAYQRTISYGCNTDLVSMGDNSHADGDIDTHCAGLDAVAQVARVRKRVRKDPSSAKRYPCHICKFVFNRSYNLRAHLETHQPNREKVLCPYIGCQEAFSREHDLGRHIASVRYV
jgi:hypothetical protein